MKPLRRLLRMTQIIGNGQARGMGARVADVQQAMTPELRDDASHSLYVDGRDAAGLPPRRPISHLNARDPGDNGAVV